MPNLDRVANSITALTGVVRELKLSQGNSAFSISEGLQCPRESRLKIDPNVEYKLFSH